MTDADDIVEAMHRDLEELADDASASTVAVLRRAASDAAREIQGAGVWSAAASRAALEQIRAAMIVAIAARVGDGRWAVGIVRKAAGRQAALLRALDRRYLGAARPLNFDALKWAERQGARLGAIRLRTYETSFARYGAAVVTDIERAVMSTALVGKPWFEARRLLDRTVAAGFADQQWRLDRILRTETSAVYNGALLASLEEEDDADEPMLKRLSATFDKVTGADSVAAHGQIRKLGEPFQDIRGRLYQAPPNRPHDREVVLPHRSSWGAVPPALGGPREERPAGGGRPTGARSRRAAAALTEMIGEVNTLRRQRDLGMPTAPLLQDARRRMREGQVVLAASRVADRRDARAGARAIAGRWISLGGIPGRVARVVGRSAIVTVAGEAVRVELDPRGMILGAEAGRGRVAVDRTLRPMAAAMVRTALAG